MYDNGLLANLPVPHDDGSFISERVSRIVELVREYDPRIDVRWIKPDQRGPDEPAFALVTRDMSGREYVIFYVQDEQSFDGSVLERLYQSDAEKQGNVLSAIDARNQAVRAIKQKLHHEQLEEARDVAYHILRSPKHTYKHNGVKYT